jgi:protein FrlC
MKLATATSVLYRYAIQDAISVVARAGYDGVDIWGGRPHVYRQDLSTEELNSLRQRLDEYGLEVPSLMPAFYRYPYSLSSPNPRVRNDSLEYMRECVDNAVVLGAAIVLIVPDHSLFGQQRADSLQRLTESIDIIARYAAQRQQRLKLGIEILYGDETDLVNSADDALAIINQIEHENVGAVLDTGTLNLSKESLLEIFDKLDRLVLQIHVNDNQGGEKQQNLIPGEGTYDFQGLVQFLKERGYQGYLSAELSKEYADDPEDALRLTAERLRAWMQAQ